jgi:hypothetical protein
VTLRPSHSALAVLALFTFSHPVAAQQGWQDRVFAGLNFGYETGEATVSSTGSSRVYGENATTSTAATFGAGPIVDATVGARVLGNIGVSVSYTRQSTSADATVTGSLPHPLFFNRPRTYSQTLEGLSRVETGVHLSLGYMWKVSNKFDVYTYGGPSSYRLNQETVTEIKVAEVGAPFTSVTVSPLIAVSKKSATGFHVGVDTTYVLVETGGTSIGIGGFARYTSASASVNVGGGTVDTTVGGPQAGLGLRVRF